MWEWLRRTSSRTPTLALVDFDPPETRLIESTLRALGTRESWEIGPVETARVVLVNIDGADGRNRWWALRRERRDRLAVAVTGESNTREMEPTLARPVRGQALAELLDGVDDRLSGAVHPGKRTANEASPPASIAEAVVRCPFERFVLDTADGGSWLFDRPGDRLYSRGPPETLASVLFRPFGDTGIREIRQRPDQLAGTADAKHCRLSLMLGTCGLNAPEPEILPPFVTGHPVGLAPGYTPGRLPLTPAQQRVERTLMHHGPRTPPEVVKVAGVPGRQVATVLAALWLTRDLVIGTPPPEGE